MVAPRSPVKSTGLRVFKAATGNKKLAKKNTTKQITRGRFRGMPMYLLTLEERATCWSGCQNWTVCYGDNMPFAKRHHPGVELTEAITADLQVLNTRHRNGYVIRLHVLGDFYSVDYVQHWHQALVQNPSLHLFGYTHWRQSDPIGKAVADMVAAFPDRTAFRRSDPSEANDPLPGAWTIERTQLPVLGSVTCPEQTGKTSSCNTCGLCMNTTTAVSFINHHRDQLLVA